MHVTLSAAEFALLFCRHCVISRRTYPCQSSLLVFFFSPDPEFKGFEGCSLVHFLYNNLTTDCLLSPAALSYRCYSCQAFHLQFTVAAVRETEGRWFQTEVLKSSFSFHLSLLVLKAFRMRVDRRVWAYIGWGWWSVNFSHPIKSRTEALVLSC